MHYYIHADKFFLKSGIENEGYLEIIDGHFGNFIHAEPNGKILNYPNKLVVPGYVDTHIHGMVGHDVMDGAWEDIDAISQALLETGVTSWLPTTLTASIEQLSHVTKSIGEHAGSEKGAKIQGIYYEGPFFTVEHKGAQNPQYFRDPKIEILKKWQKLSGNLVKKIAIAPERTGSIDFIREAVRMGVHVALGHSNATYDQAKEAIDAGADIFTHAFNGMRGFTHRAPGLTGAALSLHGTFSELICDGHHVHPKAAQVLIEAQGYEHVALITDCMRAGLMPNGNYTLGEYDVLVGDGMVKLIKDGNLAGSILELKDAVKNVVDWGISSQLQAVGMASSVAAQSAGIAESCGQILPNRDADFLILNSDMSLKETYLNGVSRYKNK